MAGIRCAVRTLAMGITATPASVLSVKAAANQCVRILGIEVGFDATDATKGPGLIEIGIGDASTAGTSSSATAYVTNGRPETIQSVCKQVYTAEPTVLVMPVGIPLPSLMSFLAIDFDMDEWLISGGKLFVMRATNAAINCNLTATIYFEE